MINSSCNVVKNPIDKLKASKPNREALKTTIIYIYKIE